MTLRELLDTNGLTRFTQWPAVNIIFLLRINDTEPADTVYFYLTKNTDLSAMIKVDISTHTILEYYEFYETQESFNKNHLDRFNITNRDDLKQYILSYSKYGDVLANEIYVQYNNFEPEYLKRIDLDNNVRYYCELHSADTDTQEVFDKYKSDILIKYLDSNKVYEHSCTITVTSNMDNYEELKAYTGLEF